jgi:hypothetical protein
VKYESRIKDFSQDGSDMANAGFLHIDSQMETGQKTLCPIGPIFQYRGIKISKLINTLNIIMVKR